MFSGDRYKKKNISLECLPSKGSSFYKNPDNIILFQKIRPYTRDINFDKQVHNYHLLAKLADVPETESPVQPGSSDASSEDPFKYEQISAFQTETIIKDFNSECLAELTSKVPISDRNSSSFFCQGENEKPTSDFLSTINQFGPIVFQN
ncbi:hypothetical protein BB561_003170 [Smittium simulii]|uniref:Uncharacterized protein n=1 Tax=Smittium simulii TaxID=133385 RepID=A0A2T9YMN5_9FUNG|nr:hypothetical protein BB561_003170 [Smittium simulii]